MCEEKKRKEKERWEREVDKVMTEGQVWGIVNRGRKKRRRGKEGIKMEEWDGYFRKILGGEEKRREGVRKGRERKAGEGEEEIKREELQRVIRKLKEGKAVGGSDTKRGVEVWWKKSGKVDMEIM